MSLGVGAGSGPEPSALLRALAHPVRLQVLSLLTGTPMSAAEVARELGLTHANASYHLRQLRDAGLVETAEERSTRGGQERRYRPTPPEDQPVKGDRTLLAAAMTQELRRRTALADPDVPGVTADAELWVDPQVWQDVRDRVSQAMVDLHAAARAPRTPGTHRVAATVALFGMRSTGDRTASDEGGHR
ncbi:MAG: metalloregulator ArsR/SmtB family transcription factor [Mycobacteriales bacterium]